MLDRKVSPEPLLVGTKELADNLAKVYSTIALWYFVGDVIIPQLHGA